METANETVYSSLSEKAVLDHSGCVMRLKGTLYPNGDVQLLLSGKENADASLLLGGGRD